MEERSIAMEMESGRGDQKGEKEEEMPDTCRIFSGA